MPKISWQGENVDAMELRFKSVREDWNEYDLEDGSTVRVKTVAAEIYRLEGKYDQEGNPVYLIKSSNLMNVKSPDHLKKK